MKGKIIPSLFMVGLVLLCASNLSAQVRFGLRATPMLTLNRTESASDTLNFTSDGAGARFSLGPVVYFPITDNVQFSTGIIYTPKRVAFEYTNSETNIKESERYHLNYIQLPAEIMFLTNEVALDYQVYFNLGGALEVKVGEKEKEGNNQLIQRYSRLDLSVLVGFGLLHQLGVDTQLMLGFVYTRGLVNVANGDQLPMDETLSIKNDYLGIDARIIF